jgi:hypothetical protein
MAKAKPAKKKNGLTAKEKEQPPIPGAEQDDKIQAIHTAAVAYKQTQQEFSEAGGELSEAKIRLIEIMKQHDKTHYQHGNVEVDLRAGKDRIKVKIQNAEKDEK